MVKLIGKKTNHPLFWNEIKLVLEQYLKEIRSESGKMKERIITLRYQTLEYVLPRKKAQSGKITKNIFQLQL